MSMLSNPFVLSQDSVSLGNGNFIRKSHFDKEEDLRYQHEQDVRGQNDEDEVFREIYEAMYN